MAERNEVGGLLGRHDPGDPRRADHVALLGVAREDRGQRRRAPCAPAPRRSRPGSVAALSDTSTIRASPSAPMWVSGLDLSADETIGWGAFAQGLRMSVLSIGRFVRAPLQAKSARSGNRVRVDCPAATVPCKDARPAARARLQLPSVMMTREPKIAYVLLRNAHFGPRLAASVELCVRDLVAPQPICALDARRLPAGGRAVRGRRDRDDSRSGVQRQSRQRPGASPGFCRRRGVDLAIVENHLPAAAFIALTSGARVILHTHAYVKAPSSALDGAVRGQELRRLSGFAFVSEYALAASAAISLICARFSALCPTASTCKPGRRRSQRTRSILCVGRALRGQGPSRGDGGDRARSAVAARMERALHGVRPRRRGPGAADCSRRFATRPKLSTAGSGSIPTFPMPRSRRRGRAPRSAWC